MKNPKITHEAEAQSVTADAIVKKVFNAVLGPGNLYKAGAVEKTSETVSRKIFDELPGREVKAE